MNPILISKTSNLTSTKTPKSLLFYSLGAALLMFAGASVSCSTAQGFGRDVEKVGDEIQDAAR